MCRFSKIHTLREWTIVDQCEVSNFSATSWKEEVVFRWDCVHFPIFCHWAYLMKIILKVISEMCCCTKLDIYVFIVLDLHTKMQSLFQKVISCKSQYHFYSWFLRMFLVFFSLHMLWNFWPQRLSSIDAGDFICASLNICIKMIKKPTSLPSLVPLD